MLSEGRSGSTWLASLANNTGQMGNCSEWLGSEKYEKKLSEFDPGEFFALALERARTPNDRFAIKIFPRHIYEINKKLGFDFIRRCREEHDTTIVVLRRRDRLRQAVSFVRSVQTRKWTSELPAENKEYYDFESICRAYFYVSQSYQYWDSYLGICGYQSDSFVYEDLVGNPAPFLDLLSERLDVWPNFELESEIKVQRDGTTVKWLERFAKDVQKYGVVSASPPHVALNLKDRERLESKVLRKFRGLLRK
jgi:LPS sulfotransferase NodH